MTASQPRSALYARAVLAALAVALLGAAARADQRWFERHVIQPRNVILPDDRANPPKLRRYLLWAGLAVAAAAWPLGTLAGRRASGELLASSARMALAAALALPAAELALRWHVAKHPIERPRWWKLLASDPQLGWLPHRSALFVEPFAGREVPMAFNAEALRTPAPTEVLDLARPTLLFAGESVVMGQGLRYEETFPAIVARRLSMQAANLGVIGYSSDQTLMRLRRELPRFSRPVAVLTDFLPGQLPRNIDAERPHLVLDANGALVPGAGEAGLFASWELGRVARQLPYMSEGTVSRAIAATKAVLRETAELSRAHGAAPIFFVPSIGPSRPLERHGEAELIRELFTDQGLQVLVVDFDDSFRVEGDGHPDARANQIFADAIAKALAPMVAAAR